MKKFNRRTYQKLSFFITDVKAILAQRKQIKTVQGNPLIDSAFRERLMLVVTEVNGCRYCSYAHAKLALTEGINKDELKALQDGGMGESPTEQIDALLYAQHWAEMKGKTDLEARKRIVEKYGEETTQAIEVILQTIQIGNLFGNTFDYALFRLSFGRFGLLKNEKGT